MNTPQKTPAKQPAVNAFPGRTRALACFRPRHAVGTDARHRASLSSTTDIIVIFKNARNITFITMKHKVAQASRLRVPGRLGARHHCARHTNPTLASKRRLILKKHEKPA